MKLFGTEEEAGQLEFAVQRFKWLRQKLHVYTQAYAAVFPPKWCVARCLARSFCTRTRSHMKQLLKSMESSATSVKAGPFTHAFKKAGEFETGWG